MRRFALGCLRMLPEVFGKMMVCDFLDAMGGYNEAEHEKFKRQAELMRIQTAILWNVQVDKSSKLKPQELWPLPWDDEGHGAQGAGRRAISDEEREKIERLHEEMLSKM